ELRGPGFSIVGGKRGLGLLLQERDALAAAAAMAERIFDDDLAGFGAVLEENLHGVGDRALGGIEVVPGILLVLGDGHFRAQRVDARIGGGLVLVMIGVERAENKA